MRVKNGQRVAAFVDFVNGRTAPYDDNGHGTHVVGHHRRQRLRLAGHARRHRAVSAPRQPEGARRTRRGVISNVIAALDWVVANRAAYNVRVVNLSVGAAVTESYKTDPLTLAAKRAVDAGIVVVTAAGNLGKNANGQLQYGGITAPGNAPWVLTVGAYSHEGTVIRTDDMMAGYSSRGPTAIDFEAKPDIVAPGTGIVSLSDPAQPDVRDEDGLPPERLAAVGDEAVSEPDRHQHVVAGRRGHRRADDAGEPGADAEHGQGDPPVHGAGLPSYNALTQGAGFLNTKGAVELARFFQDGAGRSRLPIPRTWSKQVIWGNHRITGGVIRPNANACQLGTTWGAARRPRRRQHRLGHVAQERWRQHGVGHRGPVSDDNIVWGTVLDSDGDNIVWGTCRSGDNIVWGTLSGDDNIVWGTDCGGANCDNMVWGTSIAGDNMVWGTALSADNIVWGTAELGRQHGVGNERGRRQHRVGHVQRGRQHDVGQFG